MQNVKILGDSDVIQEKKIKLALSFIVKFI